MRKLTKSNTVNYLLDWYNFYMRVYQERDIYIASKGASRVLVLLAKVKYKEQDENSLKDIILELEYFYKLICKRINK